MVQYTGEVITARSCVSFDDSTQYVSELLPLLRRLEGIYCTGQLIIQ